jgi:general secretion pathway protein J
MNARARERGLTLLEVMISVAVLTLISVLIYGAFSTINKGKQTASQLSERYRIGRVAMDRMARELQSAYISAHIAALPQLITRVTAFTGKSGRVDFNAFAHRRLMKDAHESDQCELSYFVGSNSKKQNQSDLLRREQTIPDDQPGKGGVVNVMVDDVDTFQIKYLDPMSGLWTDTWDSTSTAAQLGRLPLQVEIYLAIKGGPAGDLVRLRTKTQLTMLQPLSFALK